MKPLSEKELKATGAMIAQASKYASFNKKYNELAKGGEIVLESFESYLKSTHSIEIEDNHTFIFFGANLQNELEADIGMDTVLSKLTIYHLLQTEGHLRKVKVVSVSFDEMGNTAYNDKFQEFIIGSIINYLQFNLQTGLPLVKKA